MTPAELVTLAAPLVHDLGQSFYFTPETTADGEQLGLNLYEYYALGRGGGLGDVEPEVVRAAFGYFNPDLVALLWNSAKAKADPREAGRAHLLSCAEHGRRHLDGMQGLEALVAALDKVNAAADPVSLPLYAAARSHQLVDDLPGRALQLTTVLREHRGSAHLLAIRAVGLSDRLAHLISRPSEQSLFGWSADDAPDVTDEHRALHLEAEALTDRVVLPAYAVLDDAERTAVADGLAAMAQAVEVAPIPRA
jgi:hypothetical protein